MRHEPGGDFNRYIKGRVKAILSADFSSTAVSTDPTMTGLNCTGKESEAVQVLRNDSRTLWPGLASLVNGLGDKDGDITGWPREQQQRWE